MTDNKIDTLKINIPDQYNHKITEKKWQEKWLELGCYKWDKTKSREDSFVIDTPPPTVSGLLHMGHVFSYTQADFIARFQRMNGKNVFYPMGFDDNGLPTERLVEKTKNIRAGDLSREEFIKICEEVVKDAEEQFRDLFKSIALSVDWDQEYQTISATSRKISQLSFLDLYNKNHVYRKLQPMLWDPVDRTALAQAEIEDKELDSTMNYIEFSTLNGEKITIATTRPELIISCVALLYHPDDTRYQHLKGQKAVTALFGVHVPIIADENVKIDKGTGLVMCCTFGDETDIDWWRKHQLLTRISLDEYGKLRFILEEDKIYFINKNDNIFLSKNDVVDFTKTHYYCQQLNGLKAVNARAKMLELLTGAGLLKKSEKIRHAVKCAERSGAPLEIRPTNQWFVKILDKKQQLKEFAGQCNWRPEFMRVRIEQWIDGLNWDWCISRQRYFGVPFPVWYSKRLGEEGKIIVASFDQLPVNPLVDLPKGYSRDEIVPEMDVMDTWATSSVSPQLSSHGISRDLFIDKERHSKLFPADLRPQAHEIIRTWAFYTIVKAYLHQESVPWHNLMISGWCLAADKTKMSKSKGNVVTPVALIEEKGADIVRYWASTSRLGSDTAYSEDVLKIGKKLVNKIWNASKFAAIHFDEFETRPSTAAMDVKNSLITEPLDLWVLTRLNKTIAKATEEFNSYEYCDARVAIENFFWQDFCDNYLEIVKGRVYYSGDDDKLMREKLSAAYTIYHCLDAILRLFAPIVPHITDELYSYIFPQKMADFGGSLNNVNTWLNVADYPLDEKSEVIGVNSVSILDAIRKIKAERNVSIKAPLEFIYIENIEQLGFNDSVLSDLKNVTSSKNIIDIYQEPKSGLGGEALYSSDGRKIVAEFAN